VPRKRASMPCGSPRSSARTDVLRFPDSVRWRAPALLTTVRRTSAPMLEVWSGVFTVQFSARQTGQTHTLDRLSRFGGLGLLEESFRSAIRPEADTGREREIAHLLRRLVGQASHNPKKCYACFRYRGSWDQARRGVAKVESHAGVRCHSRPETGLDLRKPCSCVVDRLHGGGAEALGRGSGPRPTAGHARSVTSNEGTMKSLT
jgi:hypothetical protein